MARILGMGNALVDIMTQIDSDAVLESLNLPKGSMQLVDAEVSQSVSEKTAHFPTKVASGGSAANTIHGVAKCGVEAGFIGKVGQDDLGAFFSRDLKEAGIHPSLLQSATPSGKAIALVSPDTERTFATYLGAAVELSADDLSPELFKGYDVFHIEGYLVQNHALIETAVKLAKENGLQVSLDLAAFNVVEANLSFLQEIISSYVDIVFANEEEAKAFTGKQPREALGHLASICSLAIVKVGKEGSYIQKGSEVIQIGVIEASPIDTTGAGDLYASGFLSALVQGKPLTECGRWGALLSGKVIETIGAKMEESVWAEIKAAL